MGKVDPATLRSELRDALKGLGPGQTTGIIKLPSGYAIVKVLGSSDSPALQDANTSPAITPALKPYGRLFFQNVQNIAQ
jgi:parvulin-like peptidyl-prolyl isomerase